MKKLIISLSLFWCAISVNAGTFVVQDFESCVTDESFATNHADITAVVKADPTGSSTQSLNLTGSNNDRYAIFTVTLPNEKTLAECDSLKFDLHIVTASYKDLRIWINGTQVRSVGNQINGTNNNLGTLKYHISDFNSEVVNAAGNSFELGIGASRMNGVEMHLDNIAFVGDFGEITPGPTPNTFTVTFNAGSGTCATTSLTEETEGAGVALPTAEPNEKCALAGYSFFGWATESCIETDITPSILSGTYNPTENITLYAVYESEEGIFNSNPSCKVSVNGTTTDNWLMIEDFEGKVIDEQLTARNANEIVVASDPANAENYAAFITTANYDDGLRLIVTLPEGKTIANFDQIAFDFYWQTSNYKQMRVYADDALLFKDLNGEGGDNYIQQANAATWTTKTYDIPAELTTGNTFTLDIGLNDNNYQYYIDNIKLHLKSSMTTKITDKQIFTARYANNLLQLSTPQTVQIFDATGKMCLNAQNTQNVNMSHFTKGLYFVKMNAEVMKVVVR